ncbi:MAG TPA: TonB-dependent receptor [Allosphingosinicella sp.]|nr:TonB-dependent receptor [Allosphingosinicella sp.]
MRLPLTASFIALALAASPAPVYAQSSTPNEADSQDDDPSTTEGQQDVAAEAQDVAGPLETGDGTNEVVVTGSRIARPEFAFPNPIQSFTAAAVEQSGDTNITDFLADTPALIGSSTSESIAGSNGFFQSAGLNLLNLRNLGFNRTLTLVNGRRHVAGYPGVSSVDVNSIPTDLIERIDILTGGTSAIYGADGVSGVVNFVLKRNFDGIRARGQIGISELGDAGNQFGSITAGKNFADDRGNIAVAYEFSRSSRLSDRDRPYTGDPLRRFELQQDPNDFDTDDPSVFDRRLVNDVRWQDSSPDGAIDLGSNDPLCGGGGAFVPGCFDGIPDRTGSGTFYDRGILLPGSGGRTIGGSGTPTAGYFGDFLPFLRRHNFNALTSFEFSPALRVFAEGKYVRTRAFTEAQPTFDFFTFLAEDNAFLAQRFGALGAGGALLSRDNFDLGQRGDASERETWRGVIGADGKFSDHLRYEVSYVYGRATADTTSMNDRIADRYYAALDAVVNPATGQVTCRINLPGQTIIDPNNFGQAPTTFQPGQCVPLNLLGNGVASQAAIDFVTRSHTTRAKITQSVWSGSIAGDTGGFFELPGGSIGFAVGAEYRRETSRSVPSEEIQEGQLLDSSEIEISSGKFDVKEVFAEINIPILKDVPFAQTLSVGGAVRLSDYSTIGGTTTWKVDGVWAPVRDITFRGTWSQAVRAPNISELFDPPSGTFEFITDPCDRTNTGAGASQRPANCAALLSGLGFTPAEIAAFSPSTNAQANTSQLGLAGGNPNLIEETARTWTAGVVLRPRVIPGLTMAFDWYNIKLRNAINQATATELAALCVDQPDINNVFCDAITRDPDSGFITSFSAVPQNVANFTTEGADATINYRFSPSRSLGTFNFRLVGGYLNKLEFISTPGAEVDIDVGEPSSPKWVAVADLTWTKGPLTLNYGLSWFSKTRRFTTERTADQPDISDPRFFFFKEKWEHDIQAAYNFGNKFTFYGGINNFMDEKPSVAALSGYPVSSVGRYVYFGVKVGLDDLF